MNTATVILTVLAVGLLTYAWRRDDGSHRHGVIQGYRTLRRTLPLLLIAFTIVGYIDVLSPQNLVQACIGPTAGWRGLLVAESVTFELPFMGWRFTTIRWGLGLVFPLLTGGMAQFIFG